MESEEVVIVEFLYKYDKCNFFVKFLVELKYFFSLVKFLIEMFGRWNLMRI